MNRLQFAVLCLVSSAILYRLADPQSANTAGWSLFIGWLTTTCGVFILWDAVRGWVFARLDRRQNARNWRKHALEAGSDDEEW